MAVIYNSSKIVTDGLVFCLDIANPRCEVSSTKIKDVIIKDEITLVNGPEFSSNYGGGLVFDGANDYTNTDIPEVNFTGVDEDFTLDIVCRSLDSSAPTAASVIRTDGWSLGNFFGHQWNFRIAGPDEGDGSVSRYFHMGFSINDPTLYHFQLWKAHPYIGGTAIKIEDDSIVYNNVNGTSWDSQGDTLNAGNLKLGGSSSHYLNCELFSVRIYNKKLSIKEMEINREVIKRRFQ
jgi:hypothetical protein